MRDLALFALILAGSAWTLRKPWIGALMWTNVSLMSPHVLFGYAAAGWPVATIVAVSTLVGLMLTRDRQNPLLGPAMWATLAFTLWISLTLPFSLYFDESLPLWVRSIKIFLMLFVTASVINTRDRLEAFIWVCVVSIGFYGVKGGLFTLATAGNYRVWGAGGFIEGNNEVALAVITIIPLMRYLQLQLQQRWHRMAMGAAIGLCAVTALGTYSRGALLGLSAMALVMWVKNRNKLVWGISTLALAFVLLSFMPEQWWERMNTIQSYEQDESALGRINAWWNAWNLAKDRVFGGGFMIYFRDVFARYSPDPDNVHAAHSIYFQVLGEHGFIGLALFLAIGTGTALTAHRLIRSARRLPGAEWAVSLGAMVQVSMAAYAVGGAFLSLAYFDLPYNVALIAAIAMRLVARDTAAKRVPAPHLPARGVATQLGTLRQPSGPPR